jgi:hypothetical protein
MCTFSSAILEILVALEGWRRLLHRTVGETNFNCTDHF